MFSFIISSKLFSFLSSYSIPSYFNYFLSDLSFGLNTACLSQHCEPLRNALFVSHIFPSVSLARNILAEEKMRRNLMNWTIVKMVSFGPPTMSLWSEQRLRTMSHITLMTSSPRLRLSSPCLPSENSAGDHHIPGFCFLDCVCVDTASGHLSDGVLFV